MDNVRIVEEKDIDTIVEMEIEIAKISFQDEAVTDFEVVKKRIKKAMEKDRSGMLVLELDDCVIAWLWLDRKENFVTKEVYANFRSFYVVEQYRASEIVSEFMQEGINIARQMKARQIVGKVNVNNVAMRYLYKNSGFEATHVTMEMKLEDGD